MRASWHFVAFRETVPGLDDIYTGFPGSHAKGFVISLGPSIISSEACNYEQ